MGKKKNIWSSVDIGKLEKEISASIEYLENLKVFDMVDDINFSAIPRPQVISTIEKQILTALKAVGSSANMALAMFEKNGLTLFIEHMMETTISCLKEIQSFYEEKPISKIEHRYVIGTTYDKKGLPKSLKVLAISKEDQIAYRIMITEKILAILPVIEEIEKVKSISEIKGDKELPESLMYN